MDGKKKHERTDPGVIHGGSTLEMRLETGDYDAGSEVDVSVRFLRCRRKVHQYGRPRVSVESYATTMAELFRSACSITVQRFSCDSSFLRPRHNSSDSYLTGVHQAIQK